MIREIKKEAEITPGLLVLLFFRSRLDYFNKMWELLQYSLSILVIDLGGFVFNDNPNLRKPEGD